MLLRFRPSVLIFDAKDEIHWPGYQRFKRLEDLVRAHPARAIYAPVWAESQDPAFWEKFFQYGYRRTHTTIYVDEAYHCCPNGDLPDSYKAGLTRGRSKKVEIWTSTQRPVEVSNFLFSESKHFYAFKLILEPDRKKVEHMTHIDREALLRLPDFRFIYARADGFQSDVLTLNLQ